MYSIFSVFISLCLESSKRLSYIWYVRIHVIKAVFLYSVVEEMLKFYLKYKIKAVHSISCPSVLLMTVSCVSLFSSCLSACCTSASYQLRSSLFEVSFYSVFKSQLWPANSTSTFTQLGIQGSRSFPILWTCPDNLRFLCIRMSYMLIMLVFYFHHSSIWNKVPPFYVSVHFI